METYNGWDIDYSLPGCVRAFYKGKGLRAESIEKLKEMIDKHAYPFHISCPFCGEKDFDKIGLKHHLINGYCEEYLNTQSIERKF